MHQLATVGGRWVSRAYYHMVHSTVYSVWLLCDCHMAILPWYVLEYHHGSVRTYVRTGTRVRTYHFWYVLTSMAYHGTPSTIGTKKVPIPVWYHWYVLACKFIFN
jgi:hypothetical protein